MTAWIYLGIAIVLELCGTVSMKLSNGFERPVPSVLVFVFYGLCFVFFIRALKSLDLSVAYAIWSGVGTAAAAFIGVLVFAEALGPMKLACIALIVVGVVGLNLAGGR